MTFLEFPIRRYQFTLVAFLCLVAIGLYIAWFEFSGDVDRDGGMAMGVAFFFGPILGLILTGAALQAVTRNPLADPYVLGASGAAATK